MRIGWIDRPGVGWIIGRVDLDGTTEGAIKGWETRRGGGAGEDRSPGFAGLLRTIQQPDGGFTYEPATKSSPTTGFAVSVQKGRERVFDAKTLTLRDLHAYVLANHDLLRQKGQCLGAWNNPADGQVYLDVSTVVATAKAAHALAADHGQLAYFDLQGGMSVDVSPPKGATR